MAEDASIKTFTMLVEEQKNTTAALRAMVKDNRDIFKTELVEARERAKEEAKEREKDPIRVQAGIQADETRKANLAAQQGKAAEEENENETRSYMRETFAKFLGKGSHLASKLGDIGGALKTKVAKGIDSLWGLLKKGAFLGMLLAATKFLQSDYFKELKDKYLPIVAEALQSVYDTIKSIVTGFFVKGEDGKYTFSAIAGLKNIMEEFNLGWFDLSVAIGALALYLAPRRFFGAAVWVGKKIFGGTLGLITKGWGKLFGHTKGLNTALSNTSLAWGDTLETSKKSGAFRRGLGGLGGKFKGLFRFFGRRKGLLGLMIGAGAGFASMLNWEKTKGLFSDAAKGITSGFKALFKPLSDFSKSMADIATKATTKLATIVADAGQTVTKMGAKVVQAITPTPKVKLSSLQLDALRGTGSFKLPETAVAKGATVVAEVSAQALKRSIIKRVAMGGVKAIPLVGAIAGGFFALEKLIRGDVVGAGLETGGIFAPSLIGLPLDIAIMARDVYNDMYGTPENRFPFESHLASDPKGTNARLAKIVTMVKKEMGLGKNGSKNLSPGAMGGSILGQGVDPYAPIESSSLPTSNTVSQVHPRELAMANRGGTFIAPQVVQTNNLGGDNIMSFASPITDNSFAGNIAIIK